MATHEPGESSPWSSATMEEEEDGGSPAPATLSDPLLSENHRISLLRASFNATSQVALIGSNVSPIESLDYELNDCQSMKREWRKGKSRNLEYVLLKWALCLLVGISVGSVAFFFNFAVENIAGVKFVATSDMMIQNKYLSAFVVFGVSNLVLTLTAVVVTACVAPEAAGSGIPEVKAYLNGVDAPGILSLKTLVVKIIGCIAAVSSSLYVGKADPMVHTGACIASLLGQCSSQKWLRYFRNDRDRRDLVTCGSAAGVAAAFHAPVGGVLFALESLASWWRSALIWRTFFATAVVAVVIRGLIEFCNSGKCGPFGKGGLVMFDVTADFMTYRLADLPAVILLGVIGGILGSIYNYLLEKVLRIYNIINEKGLAYRLLLAATVSLFTSCCLFGLPWLASCRPCPSGLQETCPSIGKSGNFKKFQCTTEQYNDLASLIFNTNDDTIRNLYSAGTDSVYRKSSILLFFVTTCSLGILSYGIVAPTGLFVPVILTGATYGRLVGMLMASRSSLDHGLFAVLGSASLLGGTMRMTVSICVIILELTNNLLLLPLVMLVLLISKTVADAFNSNIYDVLMRLKGLPYLEAHAEPYMRQLTVSEVVTGPLQTFNGIERVGNIVHILKTTGHHGFPVVDEPPFSPCPALFGLITRAHLLVLLKNKKHFQPARASPGIDNASKYFSPDDFVKHGSGERDRIEDIDFSPEEMEMFVDLRPFSNTSAYSVVETMSVAKALILFRELGLRHLLVIPKSSNRSPVVGILTRHDFMPEHILELHPFLSRSRWKTLRLGGSTITNIFRGPSHRYVDDV